MIPLTVSWLLVSFLLETSCQQNRKGEAGYYEEEFASKTLKSESPTRTGLSIFKNGCKPPSPLANGNYVNCIDREPASKSTGEYFYHTLLVPECDNGTELFNQPYIKCAESGDWEGNPECRACCELPPLDPTIGVYYFTHTRKWIDAFTAECLATDSEYSLSVQCSEGYVAIPKSGEIKCTADGEIANPSDVPKCEPKHATREPPTKRCSGCRIPKPFSNGGLIYHNEHVSAGIDGRCFPKDSYLFVDCNRYYAPERPMIKCLGNDQWEGLLRCRSDPDYERPKLCVPPRPIENGYYSILGSDVEYNVANIPPHTKLAIHCNDGYRLGGSRRVITCSRNATLGGRRFAFNDAFFECVSTAPSYPQYYYPDDYYVDDYDVDLPRCCNIPFEKFANGYFRYEETNRTLKSLEGNPCFFNGTVLHVRCNPPHYLEGNNGQIVCIDDKFESPGKCDLLDLSNPKHIGYMNEVTTDTIIAILVVGFLVYLAIFLPILCWYHRETFCNC